MKPSLDSVSYCISTEGRQIHKTVKLIRSIVETMKDLDTQYEVVVAGVTDELEDSQVDLNPVAAHQAALSGRLGMLRNVAASNSRYEIIVFVDDDMIFPRDWMTRLIRFSETNSWQVLGNRILSPDGTRYWDRATTSPHHQMVNYDHPEDDPNLYQCGCFWVVRRETFKAEQWNESIPFYSENADGTNEDVEYSKRLINTGRTLSFDKDNYVWHWDGRYTEWYTEKEGLRCIRKMDITKDFGVDRFPDVRPEFSDLLDHLEVHDCPGI